MTRIRIHAWDVIAWAFFAAIPAIIFWQSATSLAEQGVAGGGPMENAAIFPRVIAWILAVLAVINALRILSGRITSPSPFTATENTRRGLIASAIFVAYLLALPTVGYHILTPVMLALQMRLLGLGWIGSALAAVGMSLSVAAVFEGLLNVVLPVGFAQIAVFG